jgi:hypothetical protein
MTTGTIHPLYEARQLTFETHSEVMARCGGRYWSRPPMRAITGITVTTPEGDADVPYGHWIVRGEDGFRVYDHEAFEREYDVLVATATPT